MKSTTTPRTIEGHTTVVMADPPVKLASIQSSEVGIEKLLPDITSVGVPAFGAVGMASGSMKGAFGMVELVGWIALIAAVLAGRGDRIEGWMAGATRSSGRPTGRGSDSDDPFDS